MARYRNTLDRALRVEIGDDGYEIPAGGAVEIPDRFSYVVAARGLPLVPSNAAVAARTVNLREPPAGAAQLPAEEREGFLRAWRDAATLARRNELADALRRRLAALSGDDEEEPEASDDEGESDPSDVPAAPESDPPTPPDDVEQQIAAASAAVGRNRRRPKE